MRLAHMVALALALLVASLATEAQQAGKVFRIGVLFPGPSSWARSP